MAAWVLDAIVLGSIFTLFALGLTLAWGVLNVLNLAHGAIFMFGALSAYFMTQNHAYSPWLVVPFAMLVSAGLAVALEVLAFRQIRRRAPDARSAELAMVIASVGAGAVLVAIAQNVTDGGVRQVNPATFEVNRVEVAGVQLTNVELVIIVVALVIGAGLAAFVRRSRYGQALRALAHDPYTCGLLGISANRLSSMTMFVSGALAGLAGVLLAVHLGSIQAHMGEPLLLTAFAAIVLGGVGSVWGAIVGAYVLAFAQTATVVYIAPSLQTAIAFALVIVLLLVRPQGLFAKASWQRA